MPHSQKNTALSESAAPTDHNSATRSYAVLALSDAGRELARNIVERMDTAVLLKSGGGQKVAPLLADNWHRFDGFICIMATGIVVRSIAPLLADKKSDPCVLVLDPHGKHVISLLSGHLGGGNALACDVAALTGGEPVITTASDCLGLAALDIWIRDNDLRGADRSSLLKTMSKLINTGQVLLCTDLAVDSLPPGIIRTDDPAHADIIVSRENRSARKDALLLYPAQLVVGIGCNRGTPVGEFESALDELLHDLGCSRQAVARLASIDKKNDEIGMLQFAADNNWPIEFFNNQAINSCTNLEISFAALKAVGAIGVAEPAALLSAGSTQLLSRKRKWKNVTIAIALVPCSLSAQARAPQSR